MKSFLADSNSKYIQSIDLPAGQYTFSAIVKSPNMLYSFAIEEVDGWKWYDTPPQEYLIWKFNNENQVYDKPLEE